MRKIVFALFITALTISCSTDVTLDNDLADEYVGTWEWNDAEINKTKDIVTVTINKISSDEVEIENFHGILNATFKLEGLNFILIGSNDELLTSVESGVSTYNNKTVNFVYYYFGDKFEAVMTKN